LEGDTVGAPVISKDTQHGGESLVIVSIIKLCNNGVHYCRY
jgi:hypothetical protein